MMENKCVLTFDNISFDDYFVYFDSAKSYGIPETDVNFYSIVGRNGDLIISNDRYKNIEIVVPCYIKKDFKYNYFNLVNDLKKSTYGRLEMCDEPDVYREAYFRKVSSLNVKSDQFGYFELTFNCKPQKFLKSGELPIDVSSSLTLYNEFMDAKPLIAVTGTGTITINDSVLELSVNNSTTYIDCDIQDAYEGIINRNGDLIVTNGFPVLMNGLNSISVSGCSIKIYPRWWRL